MAKDNQAFLKETETLRSLRALEEIEKDPNLSQRDLAQRLGVALGIANVCIHALVRKGLIKIRGDNNRSITYHLTKSGVLYKSRLALEWTKNTIDWYRETRRYVVSKFQVLAAEGIKTVVLSGSGELTEIALVVASETGIMIVGIIGPTNNGSDHLLGSPVGTAEAMLAKNPDAVVFCQEDADGLAAEMAPLAPNGTKFFQLI